MPFLFLKEILQPVYPPFFFLLFFLRMPASHNGDVVSGLAHMVAGQQSFPVGSAAAVQCGGHGCHLPVRKESDA